MTGHSQVSPDPSFLQTAQPQLSQPVLIEDVFYPLDHFCGPPLDTLQHVHVSYMGLAWAELNPSSTSSSYMEKYASHMLKLLVTKDRQQGSQETTVAFGSSHLGSAVEVSSFNLQCGI